MITADPGSRRLSLLLAAIVGVVAFFWFDRLSPAVFPVNDDPIRDQLMARDCTDLNACHLLGALSSFGDLFHGAVWIDLLVAVRLLGGDLPAQRVMVLAALALSAATLFIVVWRWLRPSIALPATLLLIAGLSRESPGTMLINPSMAVFPDLLTAAGLLCFALSRQRRFLVAAALALGVAAGMHTASFGLVAPFLIVVCIARPRAWRDVLAAAALAGLTYALPSSAALRANVLALSRHGLLWPLLATGVALVPIAIACGPRFRRCGWNARAWIVAAVLVVPFALLLFWFVRRHSFSPIYVHPVLAPAAAVLAALIAIPFERAARSRPTLRWLPTLAAAVGALVAVFNIDRFTKPSTLEVRAWSINEAVVVADAITRRGWSYGDLALRLQGSGCRELHAALSMLMPAPQTAAPATNRHLQIVKGPREAFTSERDVIALGGDAALLREVDSWMRPGELKACRAPLGGGAPTCGAVIPVMPDADPRRFLFLARTFFPIENLEAQQRPYIATYEIPLAPAAGQRRMLAVTDGDASACGWRITRVDGLAIEGTLPARHVRVHAPNAGRGLVVFEKPFGTPGCPVHDIDPRYPPCVLETAADDRLQELGGGL